MNNYRHGDIALIGVRAIPDGLKKIKTNVLIDNGSGGHPHTFSGGSFYPAAKDNFVIGYLDARKTTLYHPEHGTQVDGESLREARIENGIYEIRRQSEDTNDGMKPVVD